MPSFGFASNPTKKKMKISKGLYTDSETFTEEIDVVKQDIYDGLPTKKKGRPRKKKAETTVESEEVLVEREDKPN